MPTSLEIGAFVLGAFLLVLAIAGGGFKLFGAEFSDRIDNIPLRIFAGALGLAFIALAFLGPIWQKGAQTGLTPQSALPPTNMPARPTDVAILSTNTPVPSTQIPPTEVPPTNTPTPLLEPTQPITPFCAFVTRSQVEELKQVRDVATAIHQAERFASNRQNDYKQGDKIPAGVMIATNLFSSDLEQFGVIPINNQDGSGLFVTTRELEAPNAGTYWCIHE